MVIREERERVKALLAETITLLCKNGLNYKSEFCVEALIGITLDKDDVFLVNIKESIKSAEKEEEAAPSTEPEDDNGEPDIVTLDDDDEEEDSKIGLSHLLDGSNKQSGSDALVNRDKSRHRIHHHHHPDVQHGSRPRTHRSPQSKSPHHQAQSTPSFPDITDNSQEYWNTVTSQSAMDDLSTASRKRESRDTKDEFEPAIKRQHTDHSRTHTQSSDSFTTSISPALSSSTSYTAVRGDGGEMVSIKSEPHFDMEQPGTACRLSQSASFGEAQLSGEVASRTTSNTTTHSQSLEGVGGQLVPVGGLEGANVLTWPDMSGSAMGASALGSMSHQPDQETPGVLPWMSKVLASPNYFVARGSLHDAMGFASSEPGHQRHQYKCSDCGKVYNLFNSLWYHRQAVHKHAAFNCPVCGVQFTRKYSVERHIKGCHVNVSAEHAEESFTLGHHLSDSVDGIMQTTQNTGDEAKTFESHELAKH